MEPGAFLRRSGFTLQNFSPKNLGGFTLIELLIVIGVVAVLATITLLVLNPAEMLKQGRDGTRISDIETLSKSVSFAIAQNPSIGMGEANKVYISLPDKNSDGICDASDYPSLEILPNPWSYKCVGLDDLRKNDGTGWIPINFRSLAVSPLERLPVDPVNAAGESLYYVYVPGYELNAKLESIKYSSGGARDVESNDGGDVSGIFEKGAELTLAPGGFSGPVITLNSLGTAKSGNLVFTLIFPHTVNSGSNKLLIVGISARRQEELVVVNRVRFNSINLIKAAGASHSSNYDVSEIWYLVNPPATSANIQVDLSTNVKIVANAITFNGVDQLNPISAFSSNTGSSLTPTVLLTAPSSNSLVVDSVSTLGALTVDLGQTQYWNLNSPISGVSSYKNQVSPGTVLMNWNMSGSSYPWAAVAIAIKPAP